MSSREPILVIVTDSELINEFTISKESVDTFLKNLIIDTYMERYSKLPEQYSRTIIQSLLWSSKETIASIQSIKSEGMYVTDIDTQPDKGVLEFDLDKTYVEKLMNN